MTPKLIKIGYDAGHGGFKDKTKRIYSTPGKRTPDGEPEWEFNDKVARAFANELALYSGVTSKRFDDPTGKTDMPLKVRTDGANDWGADFYLSFHHNANLAKWGTWTGVETFVYIGNKNTKSGQLARAIHPALVKGYGLRDRGIKEANLHIVRETKMPAILIEGGFMDSTIDIIKLRDDKVLEKVGREIARALANYLGLKKSSTGEKEVNKVSQEFLNVTGRNECKEMIRRGVEEKLFYDKHEDVNNYTDTQLFSYAMAYVNRKLKQKA